MEDLRKEKIKNLEEKKQQIYQISFFNKVKNFIIKYYIKILIAIIIINILIFPFYIGQFIGFFIKNLSDGFFYQYK